jgi:hypothetical protein
VERRGLAGHQPAQDRQALVHALAAGLRVDPADLDLVRVLTAHADPEHEPAGCHQREVGQLARDRHRVAQRQEVDAGVDRQAVVEGAEHRRLEQTVDAGTDEEADVVAAADVIEPRLGDRVEVLAGRAGVRSLQGEWREDPDGGRGHGRGP